jgi:hypothetical protein
MYRLALALLILATAPAAAEAAPFGELPTLAVKNPARCLRATGAPGEVVRWAPQGAEFLQATASGFGAPVHVPLGDRFGQCPLAAAQPSGAAVVIEETYDGLAFAVREPNGVWGPTQTINEADGHAIDNPVAAVSSRGDVAVAWTDIAVLRRSAARLLVARRPAGGTFGAPIELQPRKPYELGAPQVALGVQDDGTVLALWNPDDPDDPDRQFLLAATAPPGAAVGTPERLSSNLYLHGFSLTVAPDGRALAVLRERGHTRVLERPPGGTFARVADLGYTESLYGPPSVALRAAGAAGVAWPDLTDGGVFAIPRNGVGPFSRPERLGGKPESPYGPELADFDGGAPYDIEGRGVRATIAGDGRPVVTWADGSTLGTLDFAAATVATLPGGVQTLSGPLRDADSITPVTLADGRAAAAWSDVSDGGDSRLHLAIEGAPAIPEPPAPQIEVGRIQQIRQGLAVPFRCSAACDVRATVPDGVSGSSSLPAAGSGRLNILPGYDPIMLRRPDSVAVDVLTGAPGARTPARKSITARLRVPRVPRLLGVKAVRRGDRIRVSWHTARPLRHASIIVVGTDSRALTDPFFGTVVHGEGRTRFHAFADPLLGKRYVQLFLFYEPDATESRIAVVPVTKAG